MLPKLFYKKCFLPFVRDVEETAVEMEYKDLNDLFFKQAEKLGTKIAYRYKRDDTWNPVGWDQYSETVTNIAMGLLSLGLQKGQKLSVISSCRPEWDIMDRAAVACGGVTVGVYETNTAEQTRYILDHAESVIVAVENLEQLDKVKQVLDRLPGIHHIIVFDAAPDAKDLGENALSLSALIEKGKQNSTELADELKKRIDSTDPEDVAAYVYTSGTTGPPKGAILTHRNLVASGYLLGKCMKITSDDVFIYFLPFAHVLQRTISLIGISEGVEWAYAESVLKLLDNLAEVRPTYFGAVPRMFEKAYSRIMENVAKSSPLKQKLFNTCLNIGLRYSRTIQAGKPVPMLDKILYRIAHKLVFSKVLDAFGGRATRCGTGSAPIAVEILEFFHAAGMLPLEGYALTETSTLGTFNRMDSYKFGTVGQVVPGMEVKLAGDGEICLRGIGRFQGYYKDPEKTKEAIDEDGWFYTGDLGSIDKEGFVTITGRKKDLIITAGGKNVAPSNMENMLKSHLFISQAMVYGDRKPYLTALITLAVEEMETFFTDKGIETRDNRELANHPVVIQAIQEVVEKTNKEFARFEQIKKFVILDRDLLQEENEITPTLKVKRNIVTECFKEQLEELYR